MTDAESLAESIILGYLDYRRRFGEITRRAAERFRSRAWEKGQDDARERILLYDVVVHATLAAIRDRLGDGGPPADPGPVRAAFAAWARPRADCEVAETFYNSVIRRLYGTIGVDPGSEFVGEDLDQPTGEPRAPVTRFSLAHGYGAAIDALLDRLPFTRWHERDRRLRAAAARLEREIGPHDEWRGGTLEVLDSVFYRNKGAYLVGRLLRGHDVAPAILALVHPPQGVTLDAVLTTQDHASIVFGFTRSYLHADIAAPRPVIEFLRSIMPLKRIDELYTAIGFHRHGKTEFYRTLRRHLAEPEARFEFTPGKEGLVMIVFTLPALNAVFKVIRDRFGHPKKTTHERVKRNYGLIFMRDRVGRLADAQEFERLELPRERFAPEVLHALLDDAARTTSLEGATVVIEHLYTERRVRPLDIYLEEVDPEQARRATLDFGQAIKDLAAADIFPGDMLVKNFGVTRHGRVIFYDYDEVAPLTDCTFRSFPQAPYPEAEIARAPHFYVGPDDVFPEEWRAFLGPAGPLRHVLHHAHPQLFDPGWWRDMQTRQRAGEVVDFFPYQDDRRLG
ncbi:MAG: bifunctional isocitrate dehydrogenase kinase/phosphatase [Gemmatimonadota bacterium]